MKDDAEKLGKPDLEVSGLQIWIHGRQFPDAEDYWDGNWLNVTAHCGASSASVWSTGNIIHLPEIAHLRTGVESLYKELKGKAELPCMEPELSLTLEAKSGGQIEMVVNITPDHLHQTHRFIFEIDQTYLPKLISECGAILRKYSIKGEP